MGKKSVQNILDPVEDPKIASTTSICKSNDSKSLIFAKKAKKGIIKYKM